MKKFYFLAVVMIAAVLVSCSSNDNDGYSSATPVDYTVMMYASGGGDLDGDIVIEMMQNYAAISSVQGKVRFVGIYKASKNYQSELSGTTYFELTPNDGVSAETLASHIEELSNMPNGTDEEKAARNKLSNKYFAQDFAKANVGDDQLAMYDPANISDAIQYMAQMAPAKKYILVTENHGGGWTFSDTPLTSKDQVFDDNLGGTGITVEELCKGVNDSGIKFEVLYDNLCLMATLENLYGYKDTFPICIASAETTTYSQIGQLVARLGALGGDASHDQIYSTCCAWVTDGTATGYKKDWDTYESVEKGEDTDCQDMGCYDLTKIGNLTTPLTNIATWYNTAMGDATKKNLIQRAVLTTLYTSTLYVTNYITTAYDDYKNAYSAIGNITPDAAAQEILQDGGATLLTRIKTNTNAAQYYQKQVKDGMGFGFPLAFFVQHTVDYLNANNQTTEATTLKGYLDEYVKQLKTMCVIKMSHDDFNGTGTGISTYPAMSGDGAYIYTSPTVIITSLSNKGFQKSSNSMLDFSSWAQMGYSQNGCIATYQSTAFDKAVGANWSSFLKRLDVNPNSITNTFRSLPLYDTK